MTDTVENKTGFVQEFGELLHYYSHEKVDYIEYDEVTEEAYIHFKDYSEQTVKCFNMDIVDIAVEIIDAVKHKH